MLNFFKEHKALRNGERRFPRITRGDTASLMLKTIRSCKHSVSRGLGVGSRRVKITKLLRNILFMIARAEKQGILGH